MKYFPASRYHPPLAGVSHSRSPRTVPLKTALLAGAVLFWAGFTAAVYTIGFIVTAP